ncbi:Basic-leucine zipper domain [Arabidopsis thaliana x Arabidopsis arenosa]|uniref:Basic-leucine zipper domain n=1 Tax=Arabidopsis thaliana x Arabidopsis arenosa TaxID=1240361 RepID=A0A8T2B1G2_9BRAS|nr:Basic-leucine zipper domain [Arabidopsis thaliana x Arabidopsis arenosa]
MRLPPWTMRISQTREYTGIERTRVEEVDYTCELRDILLWSEGLIPAGTFRDAQSSIYENLSADSPVSANKPETEAGQSEMTNDPNDLKRIRRESAKRSRRRKQEYLVDLETQLDSLKGDNSTLYKQLIDATL